MTANERELALKHGLALRDPARPELGWRRVTTSVKHADATDRLSVNTLAGTDNVLVTGIAGALQVLVDGTPA